MALSIGERQDDAWWRGVDEMERLTDAALDLACQLTPALGDEPLALLFTCAAKAWLSSVDPSPERIAALRAMRYSEYLLTPEWKARRRVALCLADWRCQTCNADDELHVHHRTYERLGCEWPEDLTVLCNPCHQRHHRVK